MSCCGKSTPCNCPPGPPGPPGPGLTSLTSPDGSITVGGTLLAPTLTVNFADLDVTEGIQDAVAAAIAATGLVAYNDAANSFALPAGATAGMVPTVNAGGTAVVYQAQSGGSGLTSLTSPNGTISIAGTLSAPTFDVNVTDPDFVEGAQDAVASALTPTGIVTYNDASNTFLAGGTAGQIPSSNGTGLVTWINNGVSLTSPDGSITVGGTAVAPTVAVNFADADTIEGIQDVAGALVAGNGILTYNDAAGTLVLPVGATTGMVPTVNGAGTGIVWAAQAAAPTITSPNGTITVGGTAAAPTVDVNVTDADFVEGVQDILGAVVGPTGLFTYDDTNAQLDLPAGATAGMVATINAGATGITWATPSAGGTTLTGTVAFDPAALAPGQQLDTTVTVTGAVLGHGVVFTSFSLDTQGLMMSSRVSSANTVTVSLYNFTGTTVDLVSGTLVVKTQAP